MPPFQKRDINIEYGGDDSHFQQVTKRVKKTGKEVTDFFSATGTKLQGIFGVGLASGIGAVAGAITAMAKSTIEAADELAKTADKVGVTTEELQELRHAASTAGVEQRTLDTALQRFSRRVGEAAQGTGVLKKEFDRLGIPLRDRAGNMRDLSALLGDYADAVANAESHQEQLRLAFVAFDTEGAGMVNLMKQGGQVMGELRDQAHELNKVIEDETIRHLEAMNQAWSDWADSILGKISNAWAELVVMVDKATGAVRTEAEMEERMRKNDEKIAEAKKRLAKQHDLGKEATRRYIGALERENEELQKNIELLNKNRKAREAAQKPSKTTPPTPGVSGTTGKGGKGATTSKRPKERAEAAGEKYATPTPEEIGEALALFRSGQISATELGRRTGQQPVDTPEPKPGAFGTMSNEARGAISEAEILRSDEAGVPSFTQIPQRTGGIEKGPGTTPGPGTPEGVVKIAPDTAAFQKEFGSFLATQVFKVKVTPELVGIEGIESVVSDAKDKVGGQE